MVLAVVEERPGFGFGWNARLVAEGSFVARVAPVESFVVKTVARSGAAWCVGLRSFVTLGGTMDGFYT